MLSLGHHIAKSFRRPIPDLDLNFNQKDAATMAAYFGVKGITFSRVGEAYYDSPDGFKVANADKPRPFYNPSTGAFEGFISEELRTNINSRSYQVENWNNLGNVAVSESTSGVISGFNKRSLINNGATQYVYKNISVVTGNDYAFWGIFEDDGSGQVGITITASSVFSSALIKSFSLTDELNFDDSVSFKEYLGNGIYKCGVRGTAIGTGTTQFRVSVGATFGIGIFLHHSQVETGANATSPIITSGANVTRNADIPYIDGVSFSDFYNQSEGTWVVELRFNGLENTAHRAIEVNLNDTTGDRFILTSNNLYEARVRASKASVVQLDIESTILTEGAVHNLGFSYEENNVQLFLNGANLGSDLSNSIPTVNKLCIGYSGSSSDFWLNGVVKRIRYYSENHADKMGFLTRN